jgi:hypothetical protein
MVWKVTILGVAFAAMTLMSCATVTPYKVARPITGNAMDVYNCALGVAMSKGYTLTQASKDSGFFKAERSFRAGANSIRWGAMMSDEMTVLVMTSGSSSLQVTAASGMNLSRNARLVDTSPEAKADADTIAASCAH